MRRPSKRGKIKKATRKKPAAKKTGIKKAAVTKRAVLKRRPPRKAAMVKRAAPPSRRATGVAHRETGPIAKPVYAVGERVAIVRTHPPGHRRTPYYVRGKTGTIERYCGAFPNPEELAYGFHGLPKRHLYRVRFRQADIWPNYRGPAQDTLDLEVYEHWLARA